jgi:general L-amino acid transport system permease protein
VTGWIRARLFPGPVNGAVSVALIAMVVWAMAPVVDWAFISADWLGASRADCSGDGACWVFVTARIGQFLYGFYPEAERWRVDVAALCLALGLAPLFMARGMRRPALVFGLALGALVVCGMLLIGGAFGLTYVPTRRWGGLMLTLVVAVVGIAASLPLGVLLALGRRSRLPVPRGLCVAFIELWRGVPLITVLFMASVMLPLFLPGGAEMDKLLRALIGVSLFAAAYMAEVVRGGLQAIPAGQYEAASALGLGYWRAHALVILPQALRHVVPGIVNTIIGLFKDTTLVLVIGLFDLLGMVQAALTDPNWLGYSLEGYVFAGIVFWAFCFSMSRLSLRFERRPRVGQEDTA